MLPTAPQAASRNPRLTSCLSLLVVLSRSLEREKAGWTQLRRCLKQRGGDAKHYLVLPGKRALAPGPPSTHRAGADIPDVSPRRLHPAASVDCPRWEGCWVLGADLCQLFTHHHLLHLVRGCKRRWKGGCEGTGPPFSLLSPPFSFSFLLRCFYDAHASLRIDRVFSSGLEPWQEL